MAASEALSVEDPGTATESPGDATTAAAAVPQRPWVFPVAQLLTVALAVFAIIWQQQQSTETLRTELSADIDDLRIELSADITRVEIGLSDLRTELSADIDDLRTELSADINDLRSDFDDMRAEVSANGQRLARIEGILEIRVPDAGDPG